MKQSGTVLILILLGLSLNGCGDASSTVRAEVDADLSILERQGTRDYLLAGSPEKMADEAAVAVTGTVHGYSDGRVVTSVELPGVSNYEDHFMVVRVKVDKVFKSKYPGIARGSFVYVSRQRGVQVVDMAGNPTSPEGAQSSVMSIAEFESAIPVGTRVAVLAKPAVVEPVAGETWANEHAGYPNGAVLLEGMNPQMLVFEDANQKKTSGWPNLTFDRVVQKLEEHTR